MYFGGYYQNDFDAKDLIMVYDGEQVHSGGNGLPGGHVNRLFIHEGQLLAAGHFKEESGKIYGLASLKGDSWEPFLELRGDTLSAISHVVE